MDIDKHLRPEIVFGYRRGLLTAAELRDLDSHLAVCATCRQQLAAAMGVSTGSAAAALEETLTEARPTAKSSSFLWYAAAAVLAVALGLSAWFAIGHREPSKQIAMVTGGNQAMLAEEQRKVDAALRSGNILLPDFMKDLRPKREVLMGAPSAARMELVTPASTAVATPRPIFRWTSLGEKWKYRVRVFAPGFQLVAESPEISADEWTSAVDLPSGVNLEWQVNALLGDERLTFPQPPALPPRFRVLDPSTIARIKQVAAQPGVTDLMVAIEWAEAGAIDDARRALEMALHADPQKPDVQRLLDSLAPR